jgi:23S rRNA-/tRNA-specific pseudouridylate synthase
MHRIDRSTSGLVLFSVRHATRGAYQSMFPERRIDKHYEAVVPWQEGVSSVPEVYRSRLVDDDHFMRVREEPGEPNSETRIEVREVRDGHALLKLSPVTGRKHQLRVHCALVTGGSRGIGRMIATGFLHQGAKVYITARKAQACDAAAAELSAIGPCISLPADVSSVEGRGPWPPRSPSANRRWTSSSTTPAPPGASRSTPSPERAGTRWST